MFERSSFAVDLLIGAKLITLYFVWRGGGGVFLTKKTQIKKKSFLVHLIFSCYYCSIDLEKQSEHSTLLKKTMLLLYMGWFILIKLNEEPF